MDPYLLDNYFLSIYKDRLDIRADSDNVIYFLNNLLSYVILIKVFHFVQWLSLQNKTSNVTKYY